MTDKEKQRELIVEIMKADEQSGLYDEPKVKLYTEEQLKKAVDKAIGMWLLAKSNKQEILDSLTPIELPSDEEIEETFTFYPQMIEGAKWMRDKIQGGNNEQR